MKWFCRSQDTSGRNGFCRSDGDGIGYYGMLHGFHQHGPDSGRGRSFEISALVVSAGLVAICS